jgi:undecaprenyl pyrophosphate synthase
VLSLGNFKFVLTSLVVNAFESYSQIIEQYAVRVNLLGKKELVYETTRVRIEDVERRTRDNKG